MVLVNYNGHIRKFGRCRIHHRPQKRGTRVFPRTSTGLHDDGRIAVSSSLHNGASLLEIIDVKGRHTELMLRSVIQ